MTYLKWHSYYWQFRNNFVTKRITQSIHLSDNHCNTNQQNITDRHLFQCWRSSISFLWKPLVGNSCVYTLHQSDNQEIPWRGYRLLVSVCVLCSPVNRNVPIQHLARLEHRVTWFRLLKEKILGTPSFFASLLHWLSNNFVFLALTFTCQLT